MKSGSDPTLLGVLGGEEDGTILGDPALPGTLSAAGATCAGALARIGRITGERKYLDAAAAATDACHGEFLMSSNR